MPDCVHKYTSPFQIRLMEHARRQWETAREDDEEADHMKGLAQIRRQDMSIEFLQCTQAARLSLESFRDQILTTRLSHEKEVDAHQVMRCASLFKGEAWAVLKLIYLPLLPGLHTEYTKNMYLEMRERRLYREACGTARSADWHAKIAEENARYFTEAAVRAAVELERAKRVMEAYDSVI
jgi:hypothetical protein